MASFKYHSQFLEGVGGIFSWVIKYYVVYNNDVLSGQNLPKQKIPTKTFVSLKRVKPKQYTDAYIYWISSNGPSIMCDYLLHSRTKNPDRLEH